MSDKDDGNLRTFDTGATRDTATNKNDYEGFLSPLVIEAFGDYMTANRLQTDGTIRDSDNWQKGIPRPVYMKSAFRHLFQWWKLHRGLPAIDEKGKPVTMQQAIGGLLFNAMGYLHEHLKAAAPEVRIVKILDEIATQVQTERSFPRFFYRQGQAASSDIIYVLVNENTGRSFLLRKTGVHEWGGCNWSLEEMSQRNALEISAERALELGLPNDVNKSWPSDFLVDSWPGGPSCVPMYLIP